MEVTETGDADLQLRDEIYSAISDCCHCDVATLSPDSRLPDIGLDSLGLLSIVTRVESLGLRKYSEDELLNFVTAEHIGDLVRLMGRPDAKGG